MSFGSKQVYTISQAFEKATRYCAMQDRCQQEVLSKLRKWGMNAEESGEVLALLITENYVNDERFARAYVRGKFNQNDWGRMKIVQGLKAKGISESCIALALTELDAMPYKEKLTRLAERKWKAEAKETEKKQTEKTARYLLSRGFESDIVWNIIKRLKA